MGQSINRRQFLKTTMAAASAAAIAAAADRVQAAQDATQPSTQPSRLAAPCGLYCGICGDFARGACHGCGCDCGKCDGKAHRDGCAIARCAAAKKLADCSGCDDMPCTRVIQFCNDPIWRTHAAVIENLRRRKKTGTEAWLKEQDEHWQDKAERERWLALYAQCDKRCDAYRKSKQLD